MGGGGRGLAFHGDRAPFGRMESSGDGRLYKGMYQIAQSSALEMVKTVNCMFCRFCPDEKM